MSSTRYRAISPNLRLTLSSRNVFPFFPDPPVGFFCFFATAGALGLDDSAMIDCKGRKEMLRAITNLPTNFASAITAPEASPYLAWKS